MAKINLLGPITTVFEQSKGCQLTNSIFSSLDCELTSLATYFKLTKQQALFVAIVFNLNYKGTQANFDTLVDYFECSHSRLLEFSNDIDIICNKSIFIKQKISSEIDLPFKSYKYFVAKSVAETIINRKTISSTNNKRKKSEYKIINSLYNLASRREEETISTKELFSLTRETISKHLQYPILKMVQDLNLNETDQYFYIYLLWSTLNCEDSVDAKEFANKVFENTDECIHFMQNISSHKSELFRLKLIENNEGVFFSSNMDIKVSEDSSEMLSKVNIAVPCSAKKNYDVLVSDNICRKELFFNKDEQSQIETLFSLCEETRFSQIQNSLKEKGQATGIAVLLHGFPGTGKTELVYQLAKQSGRDIIKIDISQSKSKYYGETEKIIKNIFNNYSSILNKGDKAPILLFNEADAILSSRTIGNLSSIARVENSIQNIILEELERFSGIFVATTNIVKNLDSAFERRFLYKICFERPAPEVKAMIWKSKLPQLTDLQCNILSIKFNFTGGQINNILRKKDIVEILSGNSIDFNTVLEFCDKELISQKQYSSIGFQNHI